MSASTTPRQPRKRASHITDTAVYEALDALSAGSNDATTKLETLANVTGLHPCTVWRSIRRLQDAGRIDFKASRGRITTYTIRGLFVAIPHA